MKVLYIPLDFHRHEKEPELFTDLAEALGGAVYRSWEHAMVYQPDVILFHGGLNPDELSTLKKFLKVPVYMWTGDCRYIPQESLMIYRDVVDTYLLPYSGWRKDRAMNILGKPCYHLWEPIQSWRFKEPIEMDSRMVAFVGNQYGNLPGGDSRIEILDFLRVAKIPLDVRGAMPYSHGFIDNDKLPDLYNNSYIVLAENNIHDMPMYFTPRNIGGMAAGSCVVMRYFPGIQGFFNDGEDCFVYHHKYDLFDIVTFLQAHPEIRNKVAFNGYKKALEHFTVNEFARKFKAIVNKGELI